MADEASLTPIWIQGRRTNVHLDPGWVDATVRGHGVRFIHHRGMRCPVGLIDPYDQRQPHPDHEGCSHGSVFTRAGVVRGLLIGNSKEKKPHVTGWLDSGTASLTVPRTYEDSQEEVLLAPFDRLYLEDEDIVVTRSETIKSSMQDTDRVEWPIVRVLDLIDWTGLRLREGTDFQVSNGAIRWTGRRPVLDPRTESAPVFAVRYMMRPIWIVQHLTHELRLGQAPGANGVRSIRLPQSAIVVREYLFRLQKQDPQATGGTPEQQNPPPDPGGR